MAPIHVVGVGVRSPFGAGPEVLVDGLCAGIPAFRLWPPFAAAGVRSPVAAPVPDDALDAPGAQAWWDRGTRLLFACVVDALSDAGGLASLGPDPTRVGMVVGTSSGGIGPLTEALRAGTAPTHSHAHYAASTAIVARALGLRGPVLTVGAVCASGAMAIAEAASWLEDGFVDAVIAAGFDPLEPFVAAGFDTLGAIAEVPCPFRAGRRGLVFGEAAAALILAPTPPSPEAGEGQGGGGAGGGGAGEGQGGGGAGGGGSGGGVIAGWGTSTDAHHLTAPHPEGEGLVAAIERAIGCAGVERSRIGVINAHGTGTQFNDAMEAIAFQRVFGPGAGGLPVHTVKGTIGHTLAAAGAVEAVVSIESLRRRCVPPTCTAGDPDPAVDLDLVCETRRCEADLALSVSAGFGGINAALLIGREPFATPSVAPARRHVVIRTSSVWVAGRWLESSAELDSTFVPDPKAEPSLGCLASHRRLQRADRATRIAAAAVARAVEGLPELPDARRVSVVSASAFASARSNEQWELARQEKRRPDPRVFAHTATNAAAGEVAAAIGARGPSLAVIGGECEALAALMRAWRFVESGLADRAVVVAFECPPDRADLVRPDVDGAVECAAAIVIEPSAQPGPPLDFRWVEPPGARARRSPLLSVGPIARIALAARACGKLRLLAQAEAGASLKVEFG